MQFTSANNPSVGDYHVQQHPKPPHKAYGNPNYWKNKHANLTRAKSQR